jgi:hypothetical protein
MQGEAIGQPAGWPRLAGALALGAALAAPLAARAAPPPGAAAPFTIAPGERITLGPGRRLDLTVSRVGSAPAQAEGPPAPRGETSEHMFNIPLTYATAPGTLSFTFWDDAAHGARLKLENGLDHSIIYAAEITFRSTRKTVETTICSVPAGRAGMESWPNDLAGIRITGLYDAPPGAQVCGYAARGDLSAPPSSIPPPPN